MFNSTPSLSKHHLSEEWNGLRKREERKERKKKEIEQIRVRENIVTGRKITRKLL